MARTVPADFTLGTDDPAAAHEVYDRLRSGCPVAYTADQGGYWALTRHEDIRRAAADSETYISSVKAVVPSDPRGIRRPPLNFDAPRHTPFRRALSRTLSAQRVESLLGSCAPSPRISSQPSCRRAGQHHQVLRHLPACSGRLPLARAGGGEEQLACRDGHALGRCVAAAERRGGDPAQRADVRGGPLAGGGSASASPGSPH